MTQINPARFIRSWLASSLLVWFLFTPLILASLIPAGGLLRILEAFTGADSILVEAGRIAMLFILPGAIIGLCVAEMQQNLTENHLNWYLPGWSTMTTIGGMVGGLLLYLLIYVLFGSTLKSGIYILMPVFMLGVSAGQAWILRRHVRHAWLWILANVVGGLLFSNIMFMQPLVLTEHTLLILPITWMFAGLAQGAITVYVLLWLYEGALRNRNDELAPVPVPVRYDD